MTSEEQQREQKRREVARDQIRMQVSEMMGELHRIALERLEVLFKSGAGIVDDQIARNEQYRTETYAAAKEFMVAFLLDQPDHYRRPHETRGDKKRINNYRMMM